MEERREEERRREEKVDFRRGVKGVNMNSLSQG
jgi:hypothetical protein